MTSFEEDGLDGLPARAAEAAAALESLREPARRAAASIDDAFARAGASLARSLVRAAADGKISMAELAEAVLAAVNAAGRSGAFGGGLGGGLGEALVSALGGGFGGARADGGPVSRGGAYLVGERGPEVFRPASAGTIEPAGSGSVTVNIVLPAGTDGRSLARSETQIAQALARAASLGARRL